MSPAEAIALLAMLLAGAAQSATGFGFAVVAAPILAAIYPPHQAVPTLAVVGLAVSLMMLVGEGRRPRPLPRLTAGLIAASVPGTALGAVVLAVASAGTLRILVALAVLVAVAVRVLRPGGVVGPRARETAAAGVLAGAFGATTGLNGPPLVLLMLRRSLSPDVARDTLTACFVVFDLLIIAALALGGTLDLVSATPVLLLAAVAGQFAGRGLRDAVAVRHEPVALAMLALSGVVALSSAMGLLP